MFHRIVKTGLAGLSLCLIPPAYAAEALERLPGNEDALVAFIVLIIATAIGAGLSAMAGAPRKVGLWATALLLLGGATALGLGLQADFPTDLGKPKTPLDPFKQVILVALMVAAALGGLFLAYTASRPQKRATAEVVRYDTVSRFLHWTTALMVVALFAQGLFMSGLHPDVPIRGPLYLIHKSIGLTVFALVIIRLVWHRMHKVPALSDDLGRANRVAAKSAHVLLYVVMLGFPLTGYFMGTFFGRAALFYWIDLPLIVAPNKPLAIPFGVSHKMILPLIFYIVFAAHIAGVIKHHLIDKHPEAIRRMFG